MTRPRQEVKRERAIRVLPPQVAAQIAAGEVILRPAAVVKELVENALDAGARTLVVEIEEGGCRRLRVVDDGWGMTPEEALLSLERHATSKLRDEADLLNITTLGFRGEALPSIAAVSRLTLVTCPPGASPGFRLATLAGELQESSPWAAAGGTQVEVAELFFNTPARRKFLKSKEGEQAYIVEVVRQLALGYPEVHFTLKTPTRVLLTAPGPQELPARVAALYGAEAAARMLPVSLGTGPFEVSGLISDPDFSLASSRFQVFLVNRRVVQDRILGAVLKEVFAGLLPRGRHPAAVLHLTLPAPDLDVNVHPAKARGALSRSGPDLRPPAGGPAPGPGAALRRRSRIPGDLAARLPEGGRAFTHRVVPGPLGRGGRLGPAAGAGARTGAASLPPLLALPGPQGHRPVKEHLYPGSVPGGSGPHRPARGPRTRSL